MNDHPGEPTLEQVLRHEALQEVIDVLLDNGRAAARLHAREVGERLETIDDAEASAVLKSEKRPSST